MYVRGSRADYDGWESMGNKGWGWEGMAPYFRKHQCYDANGDLHPDPQFMPYAAQDNHHGTDGPVHTSFNDYYEVGFIVLHRISLIDKLNKLSRLSTTFAKPRMKSAGSLAHSSMHGQATTWDSIRA